MKQILQAPTHSEQFLIGELDGKKWWTNIAVDHLNGKETNEMLMRMPDDVLVKLAYFKRDGEYFIREEQYLRPADKSICARQANEEDAGKEYWGVCRAHFILKFRRLKKERYKHAVDENMQNLITNFNGKLSDQEEAKVTETNDLIRNAALPVMDASDSALKGVVVGLKKYCDDHPDAPKSKQLYNFYLQRYAARTDM